MWYMAHQHTTKELRAMLCFIKRGKMWIQGELDNDKSLLTIYWQFDQNKT